MEGGDELDYGVPMKKVPLHPSHRGTSYVPRAIREKRAAEARNARDAYEEEEETFVGMDGEERSATVAKRKKSRVLGETSPPRRSRDEVFAPTEGDDGGVGGEMGDGYEEPQQEDGPPRNRS